jgi:hypothetical protein
MGHDERRALRVEPMKRRAWIVASLVVPLVWLALRGVDRDEPTPPARVAQTVAERLDEDRDVPSTAPVVPNGVAITTPAGTIGPRKAVHRAINAPNPETTKAVEQIRFWRQHAATGDAYAQCRFSLASAGCAMARSSYAPWARTRIPTLRTEDGELVGQDCSGVTDADVQGRFEALLSAAQRGHTPSALLIAMGGGASSFIPAPEEVRDFRAHAPRLAWQAFEAGDSDAAVLLWRAYNRVQADIVFLSAAIDPDPVKAHALDLLMDDLVPDFVVGTAAEAGLSKIQAAQAEALHAEWRSTAFAHRKPPRYGLEIERMFEPDKRAVDLCAPDPR